MTGPAPGRAFRVGVGGPVGSGKTLLIERLVPRLIAAGRSVAIVTNDILTREDEQHVRAALGHLLEPTRIVGVETGTCPHTAVREDPSMNLAVLAELEERHPDTEIVFLESGGDNLTLTFSPELVDHTIYVIDVAGGDKVPRKRGRGLIQADVLVVNKVDLAPYVGADLDVMRRDADLVRNARLTVFTDCRAEMGIEPLIAHLEAARQAWIGGAKADRDSDDDVHTGRDHVHGRTAHVQAGPAQDDAGPAHVHSS